MTPLNRRQTFKGVAVAAAGGPLLAACGDGSSTATDSGSPASSGTELGPVSEVPEGGGKIFADQKVVVTQPAPGEFKGFSSICPHQKCPVTKVTETIDCPCHGSKFSLEDGSVVEGPANTGLSEVELSVEGDSISLA